MAGDAHVPDRFKPGVLRQLEVERHVRPARLEAVDASPERLLRILRADALEQSDDLLRLAPTRRRHPDLGRRTVEHVEIADPRLTRPHEPQGVAAELVGETVEALERRGKYLVVRFESGRALLIHLRMTGSFQHLRDESPAEDPYRRAVVRLDNGSDIAYRDVRRFGTWLLLEPRELEPYLAERIGGEPLSRSLTSRSLGDRRARRRAPLTAVGLAQRRFPGGGDI